MCERAKELTRPSKTEYYLNIAKAVAQRSTCLRRKYGAIIVKDDTIVSTGYNGTARGLPNCIDIGQCPRDELQIEAGSRYDLCRGVHAEMNAVINAARSGASVMSGTMYLACLDAKTGEPLKDVVKPCILCSRVIINAGVKEVVMPRLSLLSEDLFEG